MREGRRRRRPSVRLGLVLFTVVLSPRAFGQDASGDLTSPLGLDSGLTLRASQSDAALTVGLSQQLSGGFYWLAGLEGQVNGGDTFTLFSRSDAIGPGLKGRVGLGFSSLLRTDTSAYDAACGALVHDWRKISPSPVIPTCNEVVARLREMGSTAPPDLVQRVDDLPHPIPWHLKFSFNGLVDVRHVEYRPLDSSGTPQLAEEQSWTGILWGGTIDTVLAVSNVLVALQVGYRKAIRGTPVEVCSTITQGDLSARKCGNALLGKPQPDHSLFATVAFSLNPLWPNLRLGQATLGAQVVSRLTTAASVDPVSGRLGLFSADSLAYVIRLPVFLSKADAPWGLRAGFAPEIVRSFSNSGRSDVRLLLIVARGFDTAF